MNNLKKIVAQTLQEDEGLLKHGSILFFALIITSILNYLFQVYVGRALGPANYGIFGSLVSLLYILSAPAGVVRLTTAKFTSEFKATSEYGKIKYLTYQSFKLVGLFGFACCALLILFSKTLTSFLVLPSRIPLLILGLVILVSVLIPIVNGVLQGLQDFVYLGWFHIFTAAFKLLFGVILVFIGLEVNGALLAIFFGTIIAILFAFVPLRSLFNVAKVEIKNQDIFQYSIPVLIALVCVTLLTNIDLILVKHFFGPTESGYYVAASLLARVIFFASMPIANTMFPKVSELQAKDGDTTRLLRSSLFYVSLISLFCIWFYIINPKFVVTLLFGDKYPGTTGLIATFGIGMMLLSLSNIAIMYKLAIRKFKFLYILAVAPVVEIVLIVLFHVTLVTVVEIVVIVAVFLLIGILVIDNSTEGFLSPKVFKM